MTESNVAEDSTSGRGPTECDIVERCVAERGVEECGTQIMALLSVVSWNAAIRRVILQSGTLQVTTLPLCMLSHRTTVYTLKVFFKLN